MSECRHDWFSDRWVIFAPQRSRRPNEFATESLPTHPTHADCPFCIGNETDTPLAVLTLPGLSDLPEQLEQLEQLDPSLLWSVRVVPNKFPAVQWIGNQSVPGLQLTTTPVGVGKKKPTSKTSSQKNSAGKTTTSKTTSHCEPALSELYHSQRLLGAHEVIVESSEHITSLAQVSEQQLQWILQAYRSRLIHWSEQPEIRYAIIFKNSGANAGATLSHAHSQLIATGLMPNEVIKNVERVEAYTKRHQRCPFCDTIEHEIKEQSRIVWESERFVSFCPYASRLPFLQWIVPKSHQSRFEAINDGEIEELAREFRRALRTLEAALPEASYNYVIHTSPTDPRSEEYHWRIELFPRLTKLAGFEWGSECFINPILPEEAARTLRLFHATTD